MSNAILFAHHTEIPFLIRVMTKIVFAVTTQIPLINNFTLTKEQFFIVSFSKASTFVPTKLTMAFRFPSFLRLAATPSAYRSLFPTFSHFVQNVMSGRNLSLCHSVKHYETTLFKLFNITVLNRNSIAKIRIIINTTK